MKKVTLFLGTALFGMLLVSCGSSKEAAQPQAPAQECFECKPTKDALRVEGSFMAQFENQYPKAKQNARNNARQEIARIMNSRIKTVIEDYASTYINGDAQEFKESLKDLSRTVVDENVQGAAPIKEWYEDMSKGRMFYSCIELGANSILDGINKGISNNEKLRTDFEYEKFKNVFNEEMSKINKD